MKRWFVVWLLMLAWAVSACSWNPPPKPPEPPPVEQPPAEPPPGPVCVVGQEDCECWVQRPGEEWFLMTCSPDKVCVDKVCKPKPSEPPPVEQPPTQPPPPGTCTPIPTPTARELLAQGKKPSINVQKEGRAQVTATPVADFGKEYYCSIGWTEKCNEGSRRGPVAPDDNPCRLVWEQHFLEAPCPLFSMAQCLGTGNQCPITFDPFFVIDDINQNHPQNVKAGCRQTTWESVGGQIVRGEFWRATAHGKGTVEACNRDRSVCGVSDFEVNW